MATTSTVDATHAPAPTNAAERFVFAQVYETLIDVDCDGHAYPGLARSWTTDATKTRLTVVLRDRARFSNGDPVRARDVVAAWHATGAADTVWGQFARRLADAATVVDDQTLIVSLPDSDALVLAEPALSVYRVRHDSAWPDGSGPYRVDETVTPAAPGALVMVPVAPRVAPRVVVRTVRDLDARDALDAGVDVLLTADVSAATYAAARGDFATVPLPWDRTYLLATPNPALFAPLATSDDSAAALRASLARDAVRAEARAASPGGWWRDITGCEFNMQNDAAAAASRSSRIVYRADDHIARELAERFVALGRGTAATAMAAGEFARALRAGAEAAYVIGISSASLAPCRDRAALIASAPWLSNDARATDLVPLVDTRTRAIVKRDRISVAVDWDGTLRLAAAGGAP